MVSIVQQREYIWLLQLEKNIKSSKHLLLTLHARFVLKCNVCSLFPTIVNNNI